MSEFPRRAQAGDRVIMTDQPGLVHLVTHDETELFCGSAACSRSVLLVTRNSSIRDRLTFESVSCLWCIAGVRYV